MSFSVNSKNPHGYGILRNVPKMLKNMITMRNLLYTNAIRIPLFLTSERAGGMKVPLSKMQCKIGRPRRRSYESFLRHLRKASHNCGESCANDELIMIFPKRKRLCISPAGTFAKGNGRDTQSFFFLGVPRGRSHLGLREFRKKLFVGEQSRDVGIGEGQGQERTKDVGSLSLRRGWGFLSECPGFCKTFREMP